MEPVEGEKRLFTSRELLPHTVCSVVWAVHATVADAEITRGLDMLGIDMLLPLNKLLARGMAMLFPIRMRRAAPPPSSAPAPATAAKKLA